MEGDRVCRGTRVITSSLYSNILNLRRRGYSKVRARDERVRIISGIGLAVMFFKIYSLSALRFHISAVDLLYGRLIPVSTNPAAPQ